MSGDAFAKLECLLHQSSDATLVERCSAVAAKSVNSNLPFRCAPGLKIHHRLAQAKVRRNWQLSTGDLSTSPGTSQRYSNQFNPIVILLAEQRWHIARGLL